MFYGKSKDSKNTENASRKDEHKEKQVPEENVETLKRAESKHEIKQKTNTAEPNSLGKLLDKRSSLESAR